jgi:hypothetical protein
MRKIAAPTFLLLAALSVAQAGTRDNEVALLMTPMEVAIRNKAMSDTAFTWPALFDTRPQAQQWPVVYPRNPSPDTNVRLSAKRVQTVRARMSCFSRVWMDLGPCRVETPFIAMNPDYFKISTDEINVIAVKQ